MRQLKSKIMLMKHMGVFMSKSTLSTYMVREELLKAPVIPQCHLLHLNMQVKLNLVFFFFQKCSENLKNLAVGIYFHSRVNLFFLSLTLLCCN